MLQPVRAMFSLLTSIDDLRGRVSAILRESGRRVVVIMDDIDRLDRTEIQAIFRLVKLTGDFENTAYVLAFDERMVAGAVGEKYATGSGNAYEAGLDFLVEDRPSAASSTPSIG